jgi:hypothetical protein
MMPRPPLSWSAVTTTSVSLAGSASVLVRRAKASATFTALSNSIVSQIVRSASDSCACLSIDAPSTIR